MIRAAIIPLLVFLGLFGCGKKPVDQVTYVAGDDARMNAAIQKAKATVGTFISALKAPKPGQTGFSVKKAFSDGTNTEYIWLAPVTFDGKSFHGTVNNEPEKVKGVKFGEKASVASADISDWMYIENRKLVGGETLRALRDAMTPAERAEMDRSLPFSVE